MEYDTSVFEELTVNGLNQWTTSYNYTNKMLLGDTMSAKANQEIATLRFKINPENVSNKKKTTIKLKDIILTDGNFEITADKQITVKLSNYGTDETIQKVQQIKDVTAIAGEETLTTVASNTKIDELPAAGMKKTIMIVIICLIFIAIILKIKSRKIKY